MTKNRIAAALAAPAVAAAFLTLGVTDAAAAPAGSAGSNCIAAQSATVSAPNTANALTRAGQLRGIASQVRSEAPVSCIGH